MYRRLPYVSGGAFSLKTLVLYIYQLIGTMNKQATIQLIIFFLYDI
jgi:hypothetical protein